MEGGANLRGHVLEHHLKDAPSDPLRCPAFRLDFVWATGKNLCKLSCLLGALTVSTMVRHTHVEGAWYACHAVLCVPCTMQGPAPFTRAPVPVVLQAVHQRVARAGVAAEGRQRQGCIRCVRCREIGQNLPQQALAVGPFRCCCCCHARADGWAAAQPRNSICCHKKVRWRSSDDVERCCVCSGCRGGSCCCPEGCA